MKKSKKPFALDPTLQSIKNQNIPATRQYNWHLISNELKKFKINMTKDEVKKVVNDMNHSIIIKVLGKLKAVWFKIQALINSSSPRNRDGSPQNSPGRDDINSEINYGSLKRPIENVNLQSMRKADSFVDQASEYQHNLDGDEQSLGDMRFSDFQIQEVRAVFNTLDVDNDGTLTSEELSNHQMVETSIQQGISPDLLQNLQTYVTFEKGGKVNFEEFLQFMMSRNFIKPEELKYPSQGNLDSIPSAVDYSTPLKMNKGLKNAKSLIQLQKTGPEGPTNILRQVASHANTEIGQTPAIVEIDNIEIPNDLSQIIAVDNITSTERQNTDPNVSTRLNETTTAAQFLLVSMKMSFGLHTDQQVAGLLANNNKLLINLCIQGQKETGYRNVQQWYWNIQANLAKLIHILVAEQDKQSPVKTFNILRCGLYSRNEEVANTTCRIFTKFKILLNENQGNSKILELSHSFWTWLTIKQSVPKQTNKALKSPPKQSKELANFLQEEGLCAFLHAQNKLGSRFTEQFCLFLLHSGVNIYTELFMNSLQNSSRRISTYLGLIHEIHSQFSKNEQGKDVWYGEGILDLVIDIAMQVAAENIDPMGNPEMIQDRQVALTLLVDLWKWYPQQFSRRGTEASRRTGENTLAVIKKACRDKSKTISLHGISMLCELLEKFAEERNEYAPTIYKSLTFLLIDTYYSVDVRQEIMHAFIRLFRRNKNIPISIMCIPYFKQMKMDLDRIKPGLNDFEANMINTTDFELLAQITVHPKFNQELAQQVITIICKIATSSLIFTRLSLHLLMNILVNFENNTQIYVHLQNTIKDLFGDIRQNDMVKLELYIELLKTNPRAKLRTRKKSHAVLAGKKNLSMSIDSMSMANLSQNIDRELFEHQDMIDALRNAPGMNSDNIRTDYEQLCLQERQIINLLTVFINSGIKVICEFIREQAIQTYIKVIDEQSISNKGLVYVLTIFQKDWQSLVSHAKASKARVDRELRKQSGEIRQESAKKLTLQASEYQLTEHTTPVKLPSIKLKRELTGKNMLTAPKPPKGDKLTRNLTTVEKTTTSNPYDYIELSEMRSERKRSNAMQKRSYDRKLGDPVELPKVLRARERTQDGRFKLFDVDKEVEDGVIVAEDVNTAWEFLMVNERVVEAMYRRYSQISNSKQKVDTFQDMEYSKKKAVMALSEVFAFLTDFLVIETLTHLRREDIMKIVRLINLKHQKQSYGQTCLDKQGFFEFIVQMAFHHSGMEIKRPSIFIPIFWNHLKSVSLSCNKPMFQRLFNDPNSTSIGDPELIAELTRRVNQDPNYQLPPGFYKVQSHAISTNYEPPRYLPESHQIAMGVVDDLFMRVFGIHASHEEVTTQPIWAVKVDIFNKALKKKVKPVYMKRAEMLAIKDYSEIDNSFSMMDDSRSLIGTNSTKSLQRRKKTVGPQKFPAKMTPNMRSELLNLQSQDPDQAQNIMDVATIVNEMIGSIERGNMQYTPRTRKRILNPMGMATAVSNYPKSSSIPKNRYEAMIRNKEMMANAAGQERNEKIAHRDQFLKDKLKRYEDIKKVKKHNERLMEKQKQYEEVTKERKEIENKKKYYEKLRREFIQERKPELDAKRNAEEQANRREKEAKREAKYLAEQKINSDINNMRKIFVDQKKKKLQDEAMKLAQEEDDKRRFMMRQEKLVNRRNTRLAARSIDSDEAPQYNLMDNSGLTKSVVQSGKKSRQLMSPQKNRMKSAKKSLDTVAAGRQMGGRQANSMVRLESQSPQRNMTQATPAAQARAMPPGQIAGQRQSQGRLPNAPIGGRQIPQRSTQKNQQR